MSPQAGLTDEEAARRRLRREIILTIVIAIVITGLFILERYALSWPGAYPYANNLLFFGLINLNVILICVLLFLILRNLAKLLFERRQKILGSRLRTRLIVAFSGFALIPTVIMFYAAGTFVTRSIDNWFSGQIEASLNESLEVAKTYYSTYEESSLFFAKELALFVGKGDHVRRAPPVPKSGADDGAAPAGPGPLFDSEVLAPFLDAKRAEYHLDAVEIFLAGRMTPYYSSQSKIAKELYGDSAKDFLAQGFNGRESSEIFPYGKGEAVRGVAPIWTGGDIAGVVVVSYFVPKSLLQKMAAIRKTYEDYRQLSLLKDPVRSSYILIFALISAFIFFAATWFGFLLARGIAVPIQKLAFATEKVAAGDLDARIDFHAVDELGRLIQSFNRMIDDLKASREQVERSARDLKASNLELEQRRRYMETVLSNITAGVLSFNAQGHISTINRRAREILGLGEDILGTPYREAFAPLLPAAQIDEFMGHMRGADRSFFEREVEVRIGGEARTLLARLTVLPSEQKSRDAVTAVMVIDDLTEVIKAKRISAWREIAQRIAHEVKNPLTPIQLAAQRLRKRYGNRFTDEDDQTFFESTATIIRQVSEMKKMVQEFSDFARMAEMRARPNQINDIIAETLVLYSEAHPAIEFAFQPASDLPLLSLDRSQVKRVFINLIDNAVDAMTGGGTVAIRTVLDPETRCARIEIADDGVGLPEGYRQRLYEPYFSTKKMGTGLGLAIVHQIMTDHGGRIELFENRPRGTRVVLTFPLDETADHPARAAAQGVS